MNFPSMPLLSISSPTTIDACKSLPLRPSDIFICSYPKSGTTWTQHIVLTLLLAQRRYGSSKAVDTKSNDGEPISISEELEYNHVSDYAPFFEIDAHWDHEDTQSQLSDSIRKNHNRLNRRVFNTHLRWDMLPKADEEHNFAGSKRPACGKFIYVTRNLLDVCASFYHHLSNQKEGRYEHSFTTFAQDWMDGKVAFGSPLHHLLSFAEGFSDNHYATDIDTNHSDVPLLLLSYENMKNNLREEVIRIMDFLNITSIPREVLEKEILPAFDFQSMKDNIDRFQPKSVTWLNGFQFLRRGESGDGKVMMSDAANGGDNDSCLLSEFDEWVKRERYKEHINTLFDCALDDSKQKQMRELFIGVVDHS